MKEYAFPLFGDFKRHLACFEGKVKFNLDDLISFCEGMHYSGNFCLNDMDYKAASARIPEFICKYLEKNFISKQEKVYVRGKNYYLGGNTTLPSAKTELMFGHIKNLAKTLDKLSIIKYAPQYVEEAVLIGSIYDHLKNYFMTIFNAVYLQSLKEKNSNEALPLAWDLCYTSIAAYYACILQGKLTRNYINKDAVNLFERKNLNRYLSDATSFYREMDNPARILLHTGNIITNATKKYCIIVNPLSGATEPGLALKVISNECKKEIVDDIFPLRFSIYQDTLDNIRDFDALLREAVTKNVKGLLPIDKESSILILDDNVATGGTLLKLKQLFEEKYVDVNISAIEARKRFYKSLDKIDRTTPKSVLGALAFKPVGETRRNIAINKFINEYLLVDRDS